MMTPSGTGRRALLLGAAAMGLAAPALAQGAAPWPSRPIRFIVPFAPGGASDTTARLTAQHLSQRLGQPVVVENKAGAASVIGTAEAARAAPDGYTILLAPPPFVITQFAYPNLPYDPEAAFRPVILLVTSPSLLFSRTGLATRGWPEIVEMAKARPGVLTYGSPGNGSLPHLAMELLRLRAGVDILHVPYRGGGPAAADLAGGRIDLMISSPLDMAGNLASGRAVPVAAATARRARAFPDLPTLGEMGVPDYDSAGWFGVVMPAATSDAIATRLNAEFQAVLRVEEVAARLLTLGVEPAGGSAEDFQRHLTAERNRWRVAVPAAGVTVQ